MKKLAILLVAAAAVGVYAQQPPAPQPSVSTFFNEFTAEWIRSNPNQAASTRYFSGPEQDAFEQQEPQVTLPQSAYRYGFAAWMIAQDQQRVMDAVTGAGFGWASLGCNCPRCSSFSSMRRGGA